MLKFIWNMQPPRRKREMFENEKSCRAVATIILNYGRKLCVRNVKVRICVCGFFFFSQHTRDRRLTSGESASWPRLFSLRLKGIFIRSKVAQHHQNRKTKEKKHKLLSLTRNIFGVSVHSRFGWRKFINSSKYRILLLSLAGMRVKLISLSF